MIARNPHDGVLETVDGRPALRFVRELPHSIERVWKAVSTPAELGQWFPAAVEWLPETGEKIEAYGMTGEVIEAKAPHRLAWTFNGDFYRFDLDGDEKACRLTFLHVFGDPAMPAAQTATGWDTYMTRLDALLAGTPLSEEEAHGNWGEVHERYVELFEDDPAPGREFWAHLKKELGR